MAKKELDNAYIHSISTLCISHRKLGAFDRINPAPLVGVEKSLFGKEGEVW